MAPNDNNEFERKSCFFNKCPSPIDTHPKIKYIYKHPGHLKERIRYMYKFVNVNVALNFILMKKLKSYTRVHE